MKFKELIKESLPTKNNLLEQLLTKFLKDKEFLGEDAVEIYSTMFGNQELFEATYENGELLVEALLNEKAGGDADLQRYFNAATDEERNRIGREIADQIQAGNRPALNLGTPEDMRKTLSRAGIPDTKIEDIISGGRRSASILRPLKNMVNDVDIPGSAATGAEGISSAGRAAQEKAFSDLRASMGSRHTGASETAKDYAEKLTRGAGEAGKEASSRVSDVLKGHSFQTSGGGESFPTSAGLGGKSSHDLNIDLGVKDTGDLGGHGRIVRTHGNIRPKADIQNLSGVETDNSISPEQMAQVQDIRGVNSRIEAANAANSAGAAAKHASTTASDAASQAGEHATNAAGEAAKGATQGTFLDQIAGSVKGLGKGLSEKLQMLSNKPGIGGWLKNLLSGGANWVAANPIAGVLLPLVALTGSFFLARRLINRIRRKRGMKALTRAQSARMQDMVASKQAEIDKLKSQIRTA